MKDLIYQLVGGSLVTTVILLSVGYFFREMLTARIKESISAEFKKEHERLVADLRWEYSRREKATKTADLLSEWIALAHVPERSKDPLAYIEVQRKYWELALFLDPEPFNLLNKALTGQPGANHKDVIAELRNAMMPASAKKIRGEEIVHFPLP